MSKNEVPVDVRIKLLREAYRYLSEYLIILEFHDKYSITDKEKITLVRQLKDNINNHL